MHTKRQLINIVNNRYNKISTLLFDQLGGFDARHTK